MSERSNPGRHPRRDVVAAASAAAGASPAAATPTAIAQAAAAGPGPKRLHRPHAPTIAFDDVGAGDTALLFTPGWCVSRKVFASLPGRCAGQYRVIAPDWRGHGASGAATGDFGGDELVQDLVDLIAATGIRRVVPVALAHSGWVALELRRRLGATIDRVVLVDWLVAEPPPPFADALDALQDPRRWQNARDALFAAWVRGVGRPELESFIYRDMGEYDFGMWSRAGREIARAYATHRSPLHALASLDRPLPVLHLYAQPEDADFLALQNRYARTHPWFRVRKLEARSHFPMFEVPAEMAAAIIGFAA